MSPRGPDGDLHHLRARGAEPYELSRRQHLLDEARALEFRRMLPRVLGEQRLEQMNLLK
jgi:hypothetical protein